MNIYMYKLIITFMLVSLYQVIVIVMVIKMNCCKLLFPI